MKTSLAAWWAFSAIWSLKRRVLLDAHIDQIGMVVTDIDENGFLHVTSVGGVDCRTLPGSPVTVFGTEVVTGIGCTLPPHLAKGDDKIKPVAEQCIDLGMTKEDVEKIVAVGDRAALMRPLEKADGQPHYGHGARRPSGLRVHHPRGTACKCAGPRLLRDGAGALQKKRSAGRARRFRPTRSSRPRPLPWTFRLQSSRARRACSPRSLGKGPMIGFSAALDRKISKKLVEIGKARRISRTSWKRWAAERARTAHDISVSRGGVRTGLISAPQRNTHTPAEVCDFEAYMENIAKLIAAYITGKEAQPNA